jgi:hypothetical protein
VGPLTRLQFRGFKGYSTAAQAAAATGILRQILLVIVGAESRFVTKTSGLRLRW